MAPWKLVEAAPMKTQLLVDESVARNNWA